MSEQKPESVKISDLNGDEQKLLESAVDRLLRERGYDESKRESTIKEILDRGERDVKMTLMVEYVNGVKDREIAVRTDGYTR
ncbi:MAG: hypothetical protein AABY33_05650 [Pseudomonadota bacterium]